MTKTVKRTIGIAAGLLLWAFFLIQEEFAFYGIYSLISYGVHEISSLIPLVCLVATVVWLLVLIKRTIQKKTVKVLSWQPSQRGQRRRRISPLIRWSRTILHLEKLPRSSWNSFVPSINAELKNTWVKSHVAR